MTQAFAYTCVTLKFIYARGNVPRVLWREKCWNNSVSLEETAGAPSFSTGCCLDMRKHYPRINQVGCLNFLTCSCSLRNVSLKFNDLLRTCLYEYMWTLRTIGYACAVHWAAIILDTRPSQLCVHGSLSGHHIGHTVTHDSVSYEWFTERSSYWTHDRLSYAWFTEQPPYWTHDRLSYAWFTERPSYWTHDRLSSSL